jgi:hypothetical protein
MQIATESAGTSMLTRLSCDDSLPLSERFLRSLTDGREPSAVYGHLKALLVREPGIFLERYGQRLTADELAAFKPLSGVISVAV